MIFSFDRREATEMKKAGFTPGFISQRWRLA